MDRILLLRRRIKTQDFISAAPNANGGKGSGKICAVDDALGLLSDSSYLKAAGREPSPGGCLT